MRQWIVAISYTNDSDQEITQTYPISCVSRDAAIMRAAIRFTKTFPHIPADWLSVAAIQKSAGDDS